MAIGRKTGGGSRRGKPNRATAAKEAAIAKGGMTPLEFMLEVLRDPKQSLAARLEAAGKAAPFVHPRLGATVIAKESFAGNFNDFVGKLELARKRAEQALVGARQPEQSKK